MRTRVACYQPLHAIMEGERDGFHTAFSAEKLESENHQLLGRENDPKSFREGELKKVAVVSIVRVFPAL